MTGNPPSVKSDVGSRINPEDLEADAERLGADREDEVKKDAAERGADAARSGLDIPPARDR